MKRSSLIVILFGISIHLFAQGVLILDGEDGTVLPITKSEISLNVKDQVAQVRCGQTFYNDLGVDTVAEYAFALSEDAAALKITYIVDGLLYESIFSPTPQDTILPGEDTTSVVDPTAQAITDFLGDTPLHFEFDLVIPAGTYASFELEYVQLLEYAFNVVQFENVADYPSLGINMIDSLVVLATVESQRPIVDLGVYDDVVQLGAGNIIDPNNAELDHAVLNYNTGSPLFIEYGLDPDSITPIGFSTFLPDSLTRCDSLGNGYVGLILEPTGDTTAVVDKDFILIIDKSGSMGGSKIEDAKNAAHYVLDNLNFNDRFNIVTFNSSSSAFSSVILNSTAANIINGHQYVDQLNAGGGTNISSSFDMAIPMFLSSQPGVAKVVVFLTDGQAGSGITNTPDLVAHVNNLVSSNGLSYDFSLFSFGVDGANTQLLSQLANQNNGQAFYINSWDLNTVMSDFYNTIQYPVVLNTQLTFDPPLVADLYPANLPNLYAGQQLVVFGRYSSADSVQITLSGVNNGSPVSYTYSLGLADTLATDLSFLPKVWAKKYIDHQMMEYYNLIDLESPEADSIQNLVVFASHCNGVLSPFTSFQSDPGGGNQVGIEETESTIFQQIGIYPNPFKDDVSFDLTGIQEDIEELLIYDLQGVLIAVVRVSNQELIRWDGSGLSGDQIGSGMYLIKAKTNAGVWIIGKLQRL